MAETTLRKPRWYLIPARILLVTILVTLLSFAVSLFLGILGVLVAAKLKGAHPNLTLAYRDVAAPVAGIVAAVVAVSSTVMEIRHYRQRKTLIRIEEQLHSQS
jgi:amino acid transporter